jgi:putative hydrolase of the HAD superfamily
VLRALILDFGGVLARAQDPAAIRRLAGLATLPKDEFVRRYWQHRAAYDSGLPAADFWARVLERECDASIVQDLIRADIDSWTVYREAVWTMAAEFRARGGRTAMLSNGVPEIVDVIRRHRDLDDFFDAVIISCEVGCAKPDPRIYRIALARLGVDAPAAIFVDDVAANLDAAAGLGLQTLLFRGDEDLPGLRARLLDVGV